MFKTELVVFFWSKNDSKYLDFQRKVLKIDKNRGLRLVRILARGEADFNQFMQVRNQLVIAAENFGRGENLSLVVISTVSKDMDDELKLPHK